MRALLLLLLLAACTPEQGQSSAPSQITPKPAPVLDVTRNDAVKPPVSAPTVLQSAGPQKVARWGATVRREGQAVFGIQSPTPMFLGQIMQESAGDDKVTAPDLGRGLGQIMDATGRQLSKQYPELGAPDPYSAVWSIRAMVRLNHQNYRAVRGDDDCQKWGAALTAYNAGAGWVKKAQARSSDAGTWFGLTEKINPGQSAQNFKYSRLYPHWIIEKHQPKFLAWGPRVCGELS